MKRLIALVCLCVATKALAAPPVWSPMDFVSLVFNGIRFSFSEIIPKEIIVSATGNGKTQEEAIQNALVIAVQKGIGVLVVSDTSTKDEKVIRDLAATYSSGIVNSYEIKSCEGNSCSIVAKVSPWKFQRKLESEASVVKVNGQDLAAQHLTAKHALLQRHKLITYYFSQIRQSGLEVKIREVKILPSTNEMASLRISYDIRWNPEFKKNMIAFLERLEKESNESNRQIVIQWGSTGLFENRVFINANDSLTWNVINNYLFLPIDIRFEELGLCERHELKYDVFKIDWYQMNFQKQIEIHPSKLQGIRHITAGIGCRA